MKDLVFNILKKHIFIIIILLGIPFSFLILPTIFQDNSSTYNTSAEENIIAPLMNIDDSGNFVADELIVKFKNETTDQQKAQIVAS